MEALTLKVCNGDRRSLLWGSPTCSPPRYQVHKALPEHCQTLAGDCNLKTFVSLETRCTLLPCSVHIIGTRHEPSGYRDERAVEVGQGSLSTTGSTPRHDPPSPAMCWKQAVT